MEPLTVLNDLRIASPCPATWGVFHSRARPVAAKRRAFPSAAGSVSIPAAGTSPRTRSLQSPDSPRCRGRLAWFRSQASEFPGPRLDRSWPVRSSAACIGPEAAARGDVPADRQRLLPRCHDLDPRPMARDWSSFPPASPPASGCLDQGSGTLCGVRAYVAANHFPRQN